MVDRTHSSRQIPLSVPDLRGREKDYLLQCVTDNWVSSAGPFVSTLERRLAEWCGRSHAIATVNGTSALHLALLGVGAGPGKLVMVPDWTFAATVNAVIHSGATPVLLDVAPETWSLDAEVLEEALRKADQPVAAVVAVHPLGHPCDLDSLSEVCRRFGVPLIEDAAGALGALYHDRPVGSVGQWAIFSFNGNKTVTAGGGGMIVTDEPSASRVRLLTTQGRRAAEYVHDEIGFNYRMTNVNAAIGLAQFERLEEMVGRKRAIAAVYDRALSGRHDLCPMPRANWATSSCWLYSVRCASRRDALSLVSHLGSSQIEARVFWRALSEQPAYQAYQKRLRGISHELSGTVVSLPCSTNLSDEDQKLVISRLEAWRGAAVHTLCPVEV